MQCRWKEEQGLLVEQSRALDACFVRWSSWNLVVDDDYPGLGGWGSVAAYFTWESSSCLCPQTSPIKSRPKFYPVKGEFSDENSDEGGFHKLGNPTFSHPQLVGALWPLFTDTSRRGMSAIYFTKFAPIEFLFPAPSSEEYLVLRRNCILTICATNSKVQEIVSTSRLCSPIMK